MYLIDTNIAIYLRDVNAEITDRIDSFPDRPTISLLTWVELEAGVYADPVNAHKRRTTTDALLSLLDVLPLEASVISTYGSIIAARGFSRPRILDRLIAATAIVHGLTLVTINGDDFRDIPGLILDTWPAPDQ